VVLNRGRQEISRGREPVHALQHRTFLNGNVSLSNVTTVLILRRYMLFALVPAEMEVGVKYLEILLAEFESACKHSGAQLGRLFSGHAKSLTSVPLSHLTQLRAAYDAALAFCNSTSFLQCGRTPARY